MDEVAGATLAASEQKKTEETIICVAGCCGEVASTWISGGLWSATEDGESLNGRAVLLSTLVGHSVEVAAAWIRRLECQRRRFGLWSM